MKALIFAAGLGTRLKPLTDHMPKALVEVDGRPLLDITIQRLIEAGATEIVVNVHHFAQQIVDHIAANSYGVPVRISDESAALLDTGGGLRAAAHLFTPSPDPILIHNVDILHNADLRAFVAAAQADPVTLLVSRRTTTRYLLFDADRRLVGWTNTTTGEVRSPYGQIDPSHFTPLAFSGIHCFSPSALPLLDAYPEKFPIMDFYLQACRDLPIRAYCLDDLRLLDVGKLSSLAGAEAFL